MQITFGPQLLHSVLQNALVVLTTHRDPTPLIPSTQKMALTPALSRRVVSLVRTDGLRARKHDVRGVDNGRATNRGEKRNAYAAALPLFAVLILGEALDRRTVCLIV